MMLSIKHLTVSAMTNSAVSKDFRDYPSDRIPRLYRVRYRRYWWYLWYSYCQDKTIIKLPHLNKCSSSFSVFLWSWHSVVQVNYFMMKTEEKINRKRFIFIQVSIHLQSWFWYRPNTKSIAGPVSPTGAWTTHFLPKVAQCSGCIGDPKRWWKPN